MIVSHANRFIVLAPWKTASSTVHRRLEAYNECPYSRFYDYNPHLQRIIHQHLTYADLLALPEGKLGYFVATFVRNPYDRVYSGFLQLQSDLQHQPTQAYPSPWVKSLVMSQLAENYAQLASGGFDFDQWLDLVSEQQVLQIGRNSSFPLHPAHYWTGIAGKVGVDFVGKVESFEADFEKLCTQIGVGPLKRVNENVTGSMTGELPESASQQYRYAGKMSRASISRINVLFHRDFELFGYPKLPC
jgi:Sulfotransferase family